MQKYSILFLFFLTPHIIFSQKKSKNSPSYFCGFSVSDTTEMRQYYDRQLKFLKISDNDSVVDIGAQSGNYEGILSVIGNFKNVNFFLVDIDSNCLSKGKINNMVQYYEAKSGKTFKNNFILINNTVDSLWLPLNTFKKVWILNTLHEIPDKQKMIKDIFNILSPGGEIIILELMATKKHSVHRVCKNPLLTKDMIDKIATKNGFTFKDEFINPVTVRKMRNPMYMFRYIKTN